MSTNAQDRSGTYHHKRWMRATGSCLFATLALLVGCTFETTGETSETEALSPSVLYLARIAATSLNTANRLTTAAPTGGFWSGATQVGTRTGWVEVLSQGGIGTLHGALPGPSGHGFLWDTTAIDGHSLSAGDWSPTLTLRTTSGTVTADIHVRAFARSSGGVFSQSLVDAVLNSQTLTTTSKTLTVPPTAGIARSFEASERLYVDVVLDITSNHSGLASAAVALQMNNGNKGMLRFPPIESIRASDGGVAIQDGGGTQDGATAEHDGGSDASRDAASADAGFRVGFPVYDSTFWNSVKPVMRAKDMVEFQIGSNWDYALGQQIVQDVPGVLVSVHRHCSYTGSTASNCTDSVSALPGTVGAHPPPSGIDYLLYDFEPNYEPEFTQDEATALGFFSQADSIAWQYGKKIFATPFDPFRGGNTPRPWNELEVLSAMPHADVINVQLEGTMASGVGAWCNAATQVGAQFAGSEESRAVFVQVSFNYGTVADLTAAGNCAKAIPGIAGLYIWNGSSTTPTDYIDVINALR